MLCHVKIIYVSFTHFQGTYKMIPRYQLIDKPSLPLLYTPTQHQQLATLPIHHLSSPRILQPLEIEHWFLACKAVILACRRDTSYVL